MRIIGVTGMIGSGKDEVSRCIEKKYSFHLIDYSEMFTEILQGMDLPPTRENKRKLRKERGNIFIAEMVVEMIKEKKWEKIVLSPIRRPEDYEIPKKSFPQMKLILVKADDQIRYQRLLKRGRDPPKSWNDFLEEDKKEEEIFNLTKTFSYADFIIENNESLKKLHKKVDKAMKEFYSNTKK